MNQRLKHLVYLFALVNCLNAYTQGLYKPGFIILPSRDTQQFLIDFETRDICRIKENKKIRDLKPSDILGFGFKGNRFYSSQIIRDTFVEVLIEGTMSLYRFNRIYFIQKTNQPIIKLEKKPNRKVYRTETFEIIEDNDWRGILRYLFSDCQSTKDDFDELNLNEKDLKIKVIEYNRCIQMPYTVNKSNLPFIKISPGMGLGITRTRLILPVLDRKPGIPTLFSNTQVSPAWITEFSSAKIFSNFSIQFELQYQKLKTRAENSFGQPSDKTYFETFYNIDAISIPALLKYKIPLKNFRIALLAGIQNDLMLNQQSRLITERHTNQIIYTELNKQVFRFSKSSIGYTAALAVIKPMGGFSLSCNLMFNSQRQVISALLEDGNLTLHPTFDRYMIYFTISKR